MTDPNESPHPSESDQQASSSESPRDQWLEAQFEKIFTRDPTKHHEFNFYMEYCRLLLLNTQLVKEVALAQQQKRRLERQIQMSSKQSPVPKEIASESNSDKKRSRRTAGEIARHYQCKYEKCQKSYGSEGSLNQHIRLKHSGQQ